MCVWQKGGGGGSVKYIHSYSISAVSKQIMSTLNNKHNTNIPIEPNVTDFGDLRHGKLLVRGCKSNTAPQRCGQASSHLTSGCPLSNKLAVFRVAKVRLQLVETNTHTATPAAVQPKFILHLLPLF